MEKQQHGIFLFWTICVFPRTLWLLLRNPLVCTPQSNPILRFEKLRKIMLFHKNSTWSETLALKLDVCCVKLLNKGLLNCILSKPGVVYCNVFLGADHICISFYTSCEINIAFCILNLANITCHFYFSLLWVIYSKPPKGPPQCLHKLYSLAVTFFSYEYIKSWLINLCRIHWSCKKARFIMIKAVQRIKEMVLKLEQKARVHGALGISNNMPYVLHQVGHFQQSLNVYARVAEPPGYQNQVVTIRLLSLRNTSLSDVKIWQWFQDF